MTRIETFLRLHYQHREFSVSDWINEKVDAALPYFLMLLIGWGLGYWHHFAAVN